MKKKKSVVISDSVDLALQFNETCEGIAVIYKGEAVPTICGHCQSEGASIKKAKSELQDDILNPCDWHKLERHKMNLEQFVDALKGFKSLTYRNSLSHSVHEMEIH